MIRILFPLLIMAFSVVRISGANRSDVLIVEHPRPLILLDAYQRSVPPTVKKEWPAFLPLFLGPAETLPDGITRVRTAHILGRKYFVLLGKDGRPLGLQNAGFHRWYTKVRILNDTVLVKKDLPLLQPKTLKVLQTVPAGRKLLRLFRTKNYYFVRTFRKPFVFAYLPLRYRNRLTKIHAARLQAEIRKQDFEQQIRYFLNRKNRAYQTLFTYFKKMNKTPPQKKAPQWQLREIKNGFTLRFSDPAYWKKWQRSSRIFLQELRELCRSFHYVVQEKGSGRFIIRRDDL